MSKHYHFMNTKTTSKLNVATTINWVDTKTNFVLMLYHQTHHVESMSKLRRQVNIDGFPRHFDVFC